MVSESAFTRKCSTREEISIIRDGQVWRWRRDNGRQIWDSREAWAECSAAIHAACWVALAYRARLRLEVTQ